MKIFCVLFIFFFNKLINLIFIIILNMTQIEKEKLLNKYPLPVTIEKTEIILKQMKENICKIKNKNGDGTGFFCKILNKKLLITNNHIINEEIIKDKKIINIKLNDNKIMKDLKIKDYYTSIKYDTTIIEIEDNDENINYLEIDDEIFDENINLDNQSIYNTISKILWWTEGSSIIWYIKWNKKNLIYNCSTDHGSSGSPILQLSNQKIIGIHKEGVSIPFKWKIYFTLNSLFELSHIRIKKLIQR